MTEIKNQNNQRADYLQPVTKVIELDIEWLMQTVSGQHKPIGQGSTGGDAKQALDYEDEEQENNLWED